MSQLFVNLYYLLKYVFRKDKERCPRCNKESFIHNFLQHDENTCLPPIVAKYCTYCHLWEPISYKKMNKMKILFFYKHKSSFIFKDIELLSKHYDVAPFFFSGLRCIPKLILALHRTNLIFIWFASYHAFLATLLSRKPKIIVTGGYDVASVPSIKYGLLQHPVFKHMVKYILKRATRIISVSEFNKQELVKNLNITNSIMILNCADTSTYKSSGKKENIVLTVGNVNKETWIRKGISKFVEVAQELNSDIQFIIIGKIDSSMESTTQQLTKSIPNLTFTDYVSDKELLKHYQRAKVYCQLSRYESFGIAPAEAMLCECVPVVTEQTALPEVVGDTGFYASYDNLPSMKDAIHEALRSNKGKQARERVLKLFSPEIREAKLKEVIDNI